MVDRLCDILRWQDHIHPRFLALLWEIVLKHGVDLPEILKAKLLAALRYRLAAHPNRRQVPDTSPLTPSSGAMDPNVTTPDETPPLNVTDYASVMTSTMFRLEALYHSPVRQWARSQAMATFHPQNPIEQQWGRLLLMALFNAPPNGAHDVVTQPRSSDPDDSAVSWRLIFTLAALEKVLGSGFPSPELRSQHMGQLNHIIHDLWNIWTSGSGHHPDFIHRAVLVSFLRFAGALRDSSLKDDCFRHCTSQHLWTASDSDLHNASSQVKQVMVEYLFTSILCGHRNWIALVSDVDRSLPQYRSEIAMMLTQRLTEHDVDLACRFFMLCKEAGMTIASLDILSLGTALASRGLSRLVVDFLQDARLSQPHARELTIAVLRDVATHRTQRVAAELAGTLANAVLHVFPSTSPPPRSLQRIIQRALHVMAESGQPSKAVAITRNICQSSPGYLGSRFVSAFIRQLLRMRQYRLATRIHITLQTLDPNHAAKLRRVLVVALAGSDASSLARNLNRYQVGHSKIERGIRALDCRLKTPSAALSLKAVAILTRPPWDNHGLRLAAQILVRARRLAAAKKLFARTRDQLDSETRTTIGNIILHGASLRTSRQSRQRMRTVLDTLSHLKGHGFVPDKVTANIMLKAILRWNNAIDAPKMRAIFNKMVELGHLPVGKVLDDGVSSMPPASEPTSKQPPADDAAFRRHIRPLYRIFIKAFYLRGDIRAARTVVGCFKAAQNQRR